MGTTEAIESYLGLPMLGGKNKKVLFRSIKDKIWVRLHTWRPESFSQAGKEIMLKAVVQAMPTYLMSFRKGFVRKLRNYWRVIGGDLFILNIKSIGGRGRRYAYQKMKED